MLKFIPSWSKNEHISPDNPHLPSSSLIIHNQAERHPHLQIISFLALLYRVTPLTTQNTPLHPSISLNN
jgi:hypothetical protein